MKNILFLCVIFLCAITLSFAKVIKVGTNATYPPFEFFDKNGKIIGFDADLLDSISKDTGLKFELIDLPFDGLVANLASGKVDMVISALSITDERKQKVNFSNPYFQHTVLLLVQKNNNKINGVKDLKNNIKLGVETGSAQEKYAQQFKDIQLLFYDNVEIYTALETGKVDAILMDNSPALYYIKNKKNPKIKVVGEPVNPKDVGIAIPKGDKKLLDTINNSLSSIKKSGEYETLYKKWF
ncbi:MAG: basic amino acid ABC transporter substrate-binding protein [Rickettsiales bacterium]|jgi:polar amino acid transport system substrate-binding protein|nr:basic amino acid ABC transporter substrate-binding protein [Rickettsiales bacterium]